MRNHTLIYRRRITTAVEDIDRSAPTNTPSEGLPPHNCRKDAAAYIRKSLMEVYSYLNNKVYQLKKFQLNAQLMSAREQLICFLQKVCKSIPVLQKSEILKS